MSRRSLVALFAASVIGGCTCATKAVRSAVPALAVDPQQLWLRQTPPGIIQDRLVKVSNVGSADLHLGQPVVAQTSAGPAQLGLLAGSLAFDCDGKPRQNRLTLLATECARLVVRYVPSEVDDLTGTLTFKSDDPSGDTVVPIALAPMNLTVCELKADGTTGGCADPRDPAKLTLDFGLGQIGVASSPQQLVVKNVGMAPVANVHARMSTLASDYLADVSALPSTLAPGASGTVKLVFKPFAGGPRVGQATVNSDDPPIGVTLKGNGDAPALCADPATALDFGKVIVGQTKDLTLNLVSCGTKELHFTSGAFVPAGGPFSAPAGLPAAQVLAPMATLAIGVRYSPAAVQSDAGALRVVTELGSGNLPLVGQGIDAPGCKLEPSVTKLSFGQVARGYTGDKDFTIANRGTLSCNLTAMGVTAGNQSFSLKTFPASYPVAIAAGAIVKFTAEYGPGAQDMSAGDTGTLTITTDDLRYTSSGGKFAIELDGVPAANPTCKLDVVPTDASGGLFGGMGRVLQFGQVVVNKSKTLPISLTNNGTIACHVSGVRFSSLFGGFPLPGMGTCSGTSCAPFAFAPTPSTPVTIQPGGQAFIQVAFSPTDTVSLAQNGLFSTDDVQIATDDLTYDECQSAGFGGSPPGPGCIQVGLAGQGVQSDLQVLPQTLDFGVVTLGCQSADRDVTLYNTGSATIEIDGFSIDPAAAQAEFIIKSAPPLTAQSCPGGAAKCYLLGPGSKVSVIVRYKPSMAGIENASLFIQANASNSTTKNGNNYLTVPLTGQGTLDSAQTDTFHQLDHPVADVLWVIDMDSGSMADKQQALATNAQAFVQAAQAAGTDFHLGVVSNYVMGDEKTNCAGSGGIFGGGKAGCTDKSSFNNVTIHPGTLYHDNGAPAWVSSTDANPGQAWANEAQIGICVDASGAEQGLEAMWRALSDPNISDPTKNKGFLRDEARLIVIEISDDEDGSPQSTDFYAAFLQSLKPHDPSAVTFDTVGGDMPNGCTNGVDGDAPTRFADVTQKTGGKMYSICNGNYSQIATDLSLGSFGGKTHFVLSRPCDPATLKVSVTDASGAQHASAMGADYTFDAALNAVNFVSPPPPGSTITASYTALCL